MTQTNWIWKLFEN